MNGNELAESRSGVKLRRKIAEAFGPAGVFFRGFLEHPRMVGSIIPSSRNTILRMLRPVKWAECKLFVEYGPGVGTFCRPVLDRLPRDGALVVIDTNPLYIDYLKRTIRDSRFHPVLGSAEDVEAIVGALGYEKADYVLSGLPFSTLPEGVGPAIAAATHRVVREGGAFLTYQFSTTARDLTARYFKRIETAFAWWNIPPCLLCWGWQEG
jgi:phospholipid N-methyltransferase